MALARLVAPHARGTGGAAEREGAGAAARFAWCGSGSAGEGAAEHSTMGWAMPIQQPAL